VAKVSPTSRDAPLGDPVDPLRSLDAPITGARPVTVMVEIRALMPRTLRVPEPGALLGMSVDFDDRIVHIDQDIPIDIVQQRCCCGQAGQDPAGDGAQLPDVTEGEAAKERTQGGRCVGGVEDPTHPAVPQDRHVNDGCPRR
jgi:hypothetical protein